MRTLFFGVLVAYCRRSKLLEIAKESVGIICMCRGTDCV